MKRTLFAALSVALILGCKALPGQSTNAAIVGSVTDSTNLVIPGAAVENASDPLKRVTSMLVTWAVGGHLPLWRGGSGKIPTPILFYSLI